MNIDISGAISPIEIASTFVSIITFVLSAIMFFLALNDQRIIASADVDKLDRIIMSNAVANEILRLLIVTAMLIIWISGLMTRPEPSDGSHVTLVGLALITMVPFIQITLLSWGAKDFFVRRKLLNTDVILSNIQTDRNPERGTPELPPQKS